MARIPLVLGKESAKSVAPMESVERLLNGYLENAPTGKEPTPIYGTPGLLPWCADLNGGIRGKLKVAGNLYQVMGGLLYSFSSVGVATSLGGIPGTGRISIAGDGSKVVVVAEGLIYVWDGVALNLVTDPDAPLASSVVWTDGYFVFGTVDSQEFFISALADPTSYDALDFASAESNPDLLVTPFVYHRVLYLAGTDTIEAQQNTGGTDFPFSRYEGVNIDVGLAGRDAITKTNDAVFWLAPDSTARRLDGITATKISTTRVGAIFKSWADLSATVVSAYVFADHLWVRYWNPDGCVVWDQNTERWHEQGSHGSVTSRYSDVIECFGTLLGADATTGKIYELDGETYDEDGETLPFEVTTPWAYVGNQLLTVGELEVVAQMGVGSAVLDPQITLERTKDGEVWSPRKTRRLGKQGKRLKRAMFGVQGQARAMAWRIGIYDPVQRAILGAYIDADVAA